MDHEDIERKVEDVIKESKLAAPQTPVDIMRGITLRRTKSGIPVTRIHYSADPDRDPEINPEWKATERKSYSSQAAWDREQEIVDEAGGGELVLADVLVSHWKKIVISRPEWRPDPDWACEGGFDHGKTNPTAMERGYKDFNGWLYFCGEYYMPGKEIWEHSAAIAEMEDIRKIETCYADPSMFPAVNQQSGANSKDSAKSYNDLYVEQGIELFTKYVGDRGDISFAARLMQHWSNLGPPDQVLDQLSPEDREEELAKYRKPSLYIVCRNPSERPQPGLHNWDCPNLLWEFMRIRRRKLTAQQALTRNLAEDIIQKDNHAWDAAKYWIMSLPAPSQKPIEKILAERLADIPREDVTSRVVRAQEIMAEIEDRDEPISLGRGRRR